VPRKRLYELRYDATGEPIYVEDAGHLFKISGVLFQGMDTNVLFLSPTANDLKKGYQVRQPSLEEWCEVLRRTDDPLVFEQDETGTIKAIHRKQQFAISGAIQQMIWARDQFQCLYCGKQMGDVQLTIDHFDPLEQGGENTQYNLLSACRQCNKRKGNMDPEDYCFKNDLDYEGLCLYLRGDAPLMFIGHL